MDREQLEKLEEKLQAHRAPTSTSQCRRNVAQGWGAVLPARIALRIAEECRWPKV